MSSIADHANHPQAHRDGPANNRIAYLDGLRGVAIVLVILFHSYTAWTDLIPAFKQFKEVLLLNTKSAGVQLFFFISGFVILMTLERSKGFGPFLYARWRRLFPAMLIASVMIYATAPLLPERPLGQPRLVDLLPGLSFLGARFWDILRFCVTPPPQSLEVVFWSLYVEVVFYQIFAAIYLTCGTKSAIASLIVIGVVTSLCQVSDQLEGEPFTTINHFHLTVRVMYMASTFGFWHFTWFAAGALAYCWTKTPNDKRLMWGAIACLVFGAATTLAYPVASSLVAMIAICTMVSPTVQRMLSLPVLTFLGFISYPLYLNHENMIVALTIRMQAQAPWMPPILLPVLPILLAGVIATLVAKYAEPFVRRMIDATIAGTISRVRQPKPEEVPNT